jgi:transcriptional regulator with XRE-family HTH domain
MTDYKDIIGTRLRYLRKKRKIPIAQITKALNIARSTYTNYEQGHRAPNGERLVSLAKIFDTSVDFITGKTDAEELSQEVTEVLNQGIKSGKFVHNGKPISEEQAKQLADLINVMLPKT